MSIDRIKIRKEKSRISKQEGISQMDNKIKDLTQGLAVRDLED